MSADLLNRVKKDLRSVLISAPRGVPARMVCSDFRTVVGYELPYRELGFQRFEDFIISIRDVARPTTNPNGDLAYFGVPDEKTSQISRFVQTQKKPKLKKSGAPPMVQKPNMSNFTKKFRYGPMSMSRGKSSGGSSFTPPKQQGVRPGGGGPPYSASRGELSGRGRLGPGSVVRNFILVVVWSEILFSARWL